MSGQYDIVVLDVMLPGCSGFEVVKKMRGAKNATPVLLLTARDEISDKVQGLDCGADDYMTKPFSPDELLARVRALSRRQGDVVMDELRFSDLTLNLSANLLHCGEKSVRLGFKELEVLRILLSSPQTIIPKEELIAKVCVRLRPLLPHRPIPWGRGVRAGPFDREEHRRPPRRKNFSGQRPGLGHNLYRHHPACHTLNARPLRLSSRARENSPL